MKRKNIGVLCILMSGIFFALMSMFIKLAGDIPFIQKAFFRNSVAAVVFFFVLLKSGDSFRYEKKYLPVLTLRSICGNLGLIFNFYAIDYLVLSDANMLNKLSPFAAVIFSYLFLKEKMKRYQVLGLITAFLGALLIIKPGTGFLHSSAGLIGLLGGVFAGAAYTAVRYLGTHGLKGTKIIFFFSVFSTVMLLPFLIFDYTPMTGIQWIYLILCGLCATVAQFFITTAYTYAPAKEISIFDYFQIIVAALLSLVVFRTTPDLYSIIGYIVIFTTSFIIWKKNNSES